MEKQKIDITIAHSPDSDDAFMFYGLAKAMFDTDGIQFKHVLKDIETLNKSAIEGKYEVSAISIHAYAYVHEKYLLLPCGASIGNGYGPIVIGKKKEKREDLVGKKIAVPGKMTTAYLAMKLYQKEFEEVIMPFDKIMAAVLDGQVDAGVVIHEGQLTFQENQLEKIVDLGAWWKEEYGLPLPLGGNVIRKDLQEELLRKVSSLIKKSIIYGLENREMALEHASVFAKELNKDNLDRFIQMYVNQSTVEYSQEDKKAISVLFGEGYKKGLMEKEIQAEFSELSL